jgi:hypothetical protein
MSKGTHNGVCQCESRKFGVLVTHDTKRGVELEMDVGVDVDVKLKLELEVVGGSVFGFGSKPCPPGGGGKRKSLAIRFVCSSDQVQVARTGQCDASKAVLRLIFQGLYHPLCPLPKETGNNANIKRIESKRASC